MILTTKNSIREALNNETTINKICLQIGAKDYEVQKLASIARNKKIPYHTNFLSLIKLSIWCITNGNKYIASSHIMLK